MNLVFRLNYHTTPGQSLWLKYSMLAGGGEVRIDQVVPMRWLNDRQWETEVELSGGEAVRIEYSYQLRQDWNGLALDEWGSARVKELVVSAWDGQLLLDTWSSAGTVDHAFETDAFAASQRSRDAFSKPLLPRGANHTFQLHMAAVPAGMVPCLLGSVREIGDWRHSAAVPLVEFAPNRWCVHLYLPADWYIEYKYGLFDPGSGRCVSLEQGENRVLPPHEAGGRRWTTVSDEAYRRRPEALLRGAGVAVPVFSLRSPKGLGVGEFADLKPFADWAAGAGMKLIQILPINDTTSAHDWTDSYPYSAISVFALHPIYLRIDDLGHPMPQDFQKELEALRAELNGRDAIDHEAVMAAKWRLTRRVFDAHRETILEDGGFRDFLTTQGHWLVPYAVFCVQRDRHGTADFSRWGEWAGYDGARVRAVVDPKHPDWPEASYHIWLQYELDRQLVDAVRHLGECGVALKGDLPIGIDRESVDAWSAPHLFRMDAQAGAPPDAFAVKGQNWGFPTYHWEVMQQDGYAWWRSRFAHLSRYFDAFRIDHILGFFRIWQVPLEQVEGIMGHFDPAQPVSMDEIHARGIDFDFLRYCRPYLREHSLQDRFGDAVAEVKARYLDDRGEGWYSLREEVSTQRKIIDRLTGDPDHGGLLEPLLDCASEVLFFEVPGSGGTRFHPRCGLHATRSFQELGSEDRRRIDELYVDYFYRRQEDFWQARGFEKLPAMRRASRMLLCGEDLGMVPACVPGVLGELGILSLEIQRMPKSPQVEFFDPRHAPYMSVVSPSTHDMSTLRAWWQEDRGATARFAHHHLGEDFPAEELTGEMAGRIIRQHLESPAMWAIFPIQDLLAMDETLRHPDPDAERINVPAIMPYYWRYRMHLGIDQLADATDFTETLAAMVRETGR
ncbi:4-alpha-glucanotransferase [Haloferula sargassicola]|uniref:4-alpha-glucanotransferase n=1 Tax=Haloferula sargassicola TaxID=490096 RepID=A0ABP9UNB8_9BACT